MKNILCKFPMAILIACTSLSVQNIAFSQNVTKRTITVNGQVVPVPDDASTGTERAVVGLVQGVTTTDVNNIINSRVPGIIANQPVAQAVISSFYAPNGAGAHLCVLGAPRNYPYLDQFCPTRYGPIALILGGQDNTR